MPSAPAGNTNIRLFPILADIKISPILWGSWPSGPLFLRLWGISYTPMRMLYIKQGEIYANFKRFGPLNIDEFNQNLAKIISKAQRKKSGPTDRSMSPFWNFALYIDAPYIVGVWVKVRYQQRGQYFLRRGPGAQMGARKNNKFSLQQDQ